jgi:hypothetical protein
MVGRKPRPHSLRESVAGGPDRVSAAAAASRKTSQNYSYGGQVSRIGLSHFGSSRTHCFARDYREAPTVSLEVQYLAHTPKSHFPSMARFTLPCLAVSV